MAEVALGSSIKLTVFENPDQPGSLISQEHCNRIISLVFLDHEYYYSSRMKYALAYF